MPTGWAVMEMGNVANYINGRAFKPEEWETNGLPIVRIQNLNDIQAPYNYSTQAYEPKYLLNDGDLLFAWAASLGTYIWNGGDAWLNQHIFKVEPYSFLDKTFMYYALQSMIADFYNQSHGSGMVHITRAKFVQLPFFLPPLNEQKRIVVKIEQLFAMLDKITESL